MSPQRILGVVLLVLGIVLFAFGWNATDTVTEEVSEGLTGKYTDETMWYIIGGLVVAIVGLALTLFGRGRTPRLT